MAKIYLDQLNNLLDELNLKTAISGPIEVKHFFSGATVYINHQICASLSPAGLAFKLDEKASQLIKSGDAIPLKYFAKGHVKQGYALFVNPDLLDKPKWIYYFIEASKQTQ